MPNDVGDASCGNQYDDFDAKSDVQFTARAKAKADASLAADYKHFSLDLQMTKSKNCLPCARAKVRVDAQLEKAKADEAIHVAETDSHSNATSASPPNILPETVLRKAEAREVDLLTMKMPTLLRHPTSST